MPPSTAAAVARLAIGFSPPNAAPSCRTPAAAAAEDDAVEDPSAPTAAPGTGAEDISGTAPVPAPAAGAATGTSAAAGPDAGSAEPVTTGGATPTGETAPAALATPMPSPAWWMTAPCCTAPVRLILDTRSSTPLPKAVNPVATLLPKAENPAATAAGANAAPGPPGWTVPAATGAATGAPE